MSIYQAHIQKYLMNRGLIKEEKGLGLFGDGEMDEPESTGCHFTCGS